MTDTMMTCESFNDRLMPYLEQETDDATRAALERHALTCAECGAILSEIRKLRIDAANLPELAPSRDLWAGIAARIEAPVVPIGTMRQVQQDRRAVMRRWVRVGAIAAALVAAAGIGYFAAGSRTSLDVATVPPGVQPETLPALVVGPDSALTNQIVPRTPSTTPNVASRDPIAPVPMPPSGGQVAAQVAVATLSADYDREIKRLRTLIEQRRNQLDPVTVAIIERNLQVIDTAIVECKKAIARDPASRFLIESLNQSLQTKVELMRTAALLPVRT